MKRILILMLVVTMLVMTMSVTAMAEGSETDAPQTETTTPETTTPEATTPDPVPPAATNAESGGSAAEAFVEYLFSGAEGSQELMDKIIAMGEQYKTSKEEGYTFKERMVQMLTTENIVTLSSAAFLIVCGIAFFAIEAKRKKDRKAIGSYIARLDKKYSEEVASNSETKAAMLSFNDDVKAALGAQDLEIRAMKEQLLQLCKDSNTNKLDLDKTTRANQAVAKMVKDVFLNSKTIDANAKSLLVRNYLDAVECNDGVRTDEDEQKT